MGAPNKAESREIAIFPSRQDLAIFRKANRKSCVVYQIMTLVLALSDLQRWFELIETFLTAMPRKSVLKIYHIS